MAMTGRVEEGEAGGHTGLCPHQGGSSARMTCDLQMQGVGMRVWAGLLRAGQ